MGQCVGDNWDPRLDNVAPAAVKGKPDEIRAWAIEGMKTCAVEELKAAPRGAEVSEVKAGRHPSKPWIAVLARK